MFTDDTRSLLYELWYTTYPNALYQVVQFSISFSSMLFVGRLGDSTYLASAALGNMICNITGMSVGYGLASALDTLCSQSYGSKLYKLVGLHLQRGLCILTLAAIPTSIVWSYTYDILIYVQIDPAVAILSHQWVQTMQWSLWASYTTSCLTKFLIAQGVLWPIIVSSLAAAITNITLNVLNYEVLHNGYSGAAASTVLANWVLFLTLSILIYARHRYHRKRAVPVYYTDDIEHIDPTDTWPTVTIQVLHNWTQFLQLALPAAISLFIEWSSFEAVSFLASEFGVTNLAVHSILQQSCGIFYMLPLALASATTSLIGQRLGSNKIQQVITLVKISFTLAFVYGIVNGTLFTIILRSYWIDIFTDDKTVLSATYSVIPVLLLYGTFDSTKVIAMSILRGSGRPEVTVYGNILSCLILMFPLSYLLAFKLHMELVGLWLSMSAAWLSCTLIYGYVIYNTDWQQQVQYAVQRNSQAVSITTTNEIELEKLIDDSIPTTVDDSTVFLKYLEPTTIPTPRRRSPHVRTLSHKYVDELHLTA